MLCQYSNVDVAHQPRLQGKSTYTLRKLLKLSLDGIISLLQSTPLCFGCNWIGHCIDCQNVRGLASRALLRVGCGTGKESLLALQRDGIVTAFDATPKMVELANEWAEDFDYTLNAYSLHWRMEWVVGTTSATRRPG